MDQNTTENPAAEMAPEELERYMHGNVTRAELLNLLQGMLAREVEPLVDSKFAFAIGILRTMLIASGAMTQDQFNEAYQGIVDEFTKKFGDGEENASADAEVSGA